MTWPPQYTLYLVVTMHDSGPVGIDVALVVTRKGADAPNTTSHLLEDDLEQGEVDDRLAWFKQSLDVQFVKGWPP